MLRQLQTTLAAFNRNMHCSTPATTSIQRSGHILPRQFRPMPLTKSTTVSTHTPPRLSHPGRYSYVQFSQPSCYAHVRNVIDQIHTPPLDDLFCIDFPSFPAPLFFPNFHFFLFQTKSLNACPLTAGKTPGATRLTADCF